ncbi:MAG: DUF2304 domain-containing protein [Candidatus Omnitrophota bacterium]
MHVKIISAGILLGFLAFLIELIRQEKLTFKYAFGWMILFVAGLFFVIFDQALFRMATFLGFELPSNFIFFSLLSFFIFLSLLSTTFLYQQERRNEIMAQKMALLEKEINDLKEKKMV